MGVPIHIVNRGNDRRQLFFQPADYEKVLALMAEALPKWPVEIHAYEAMPNHIHLVLRQWEPGAISAYVHRVLGGIAFNHRKNTGTIGMGHVFQRRFWSHVIVDGRHYLTAVRYVESNAKHAGLVKRAEDWRWGSLWERVVGGRELLAAPIMALPQDWVTLVNVELPEAERTGFTQAAGRGRQSKSATRPPGSLNGAG